MSNVTTEKVIARGKSAAPRGIKRSRLEPIIPEGWRIPNHLQAAWRPTTLLDIAGRSAACHFFQPLPRLAPGLKPKPPLLGSTVAIAPALCRAPTRDSLLGNLYHLRNLGPALFSCFVIQRILNCLRGRQGVSLRGTIPLSSLIRGFCL